ncbi:flagellar biosynthesis protein FlhB [Stenotrophobium rhamnosiphilum]|uniref:Flagellar biosynthetic protein FlhB n=1 Tax=Stenotrophobium rhamnosiphilum TaxID=2029166 RepID=A0A2T5MDD8_9GAMM|nr:flagellar biosynthesis protein FlhB [Stenotrophobium rhamnosiphilum]PTU30567.1 flagellar biosynthetic protein FlhB [Stenotrophobium rhamnosiphilum]
MSESSAQEKTESASPKRRREARERGQVPRSRDLTTALVMVAGAGLLISHGGDIVTGAQQLMRSSLTIDPAVLTDSGQLPMFLGQTFGKAMHLLMPVFIGLVVMAIVAPMLLGGWNFSAKAFMPDIDRINPLTGLGRIFSINSLIELMKSMLKLIVLGVVAGMAWWSTRSELIGLSSESTNQGLAHAGMLFTHSFAFLCGAMLLIALLDVPYQIWQYEKQLKMTKQELRDEYKESEGRPEVKARVRQIQREMSRRRMMEQVPTADVIVTNPTHYAVALKYTADKTRAPVVVAKGADQIALAIRELGKQNRVPILEAPPLARALYRSTELDQEIPTTLYAAVAQVLSYVYQLRMYRSGPPPVMPDIGDVPGGELDEK